MDVGREWQELDKQTCYQLRTIHLCPYTQVFCVQVGQVVRSWQRLIHDFVSVVTSSLINSRCAPQRQGNLWSGLKSAQFQSRVVSYYRAVSTIGPIKDHKQGVGALKNLSHGSLIGKPRIQYTSVRYTLTEPPPPPSVTVDSLGCHQEHQQTGCWVMSK